MVLKALLSLAVWSKLLALYTNKISMKKITLLLTVALLISNFSDAQKKSTDKKETKPATITDPMLKPETYSSLSFRSIGPAVTSGRVVDIAVNPKNKNEWYIAAASGGVWKTSNAGVTFSPIFDGQSAYSIGCVSIDPVNTNVIWVGSGENNNQRVVGYGDGVYKSEER